MHESTVIVFALSFILCFLAVFQTKLPLLSLLLSAVGCHSGLAATFFPLLFFYRRDQQPNLIFGSHSLPFFPRIFSSPFGKSFLGNRDRVYGAAQGCLSCWIGPDYPQRPSTQHLPCKVSTMLTPQTRNTIAPLPPPCYSLVNDASLIPPPLFSPFFLALLTAFYLLECSSEL